VGLKFSYLKVTDFELLIGEFKVKIGLSNFRSIY
jgi:hypothetical protein